jgi:hypothetical protein
MFLTWISAMIKAAVLRGFREAIEELDLEHDEAPDSALTALKGRMTALPAPSSNGTTKRAKASKE